MDAPFGNDDRGQLVVLGVGIAYRLHREPETLQCLGHLAGRSAHAITVENLNAQGLFRQQVSSPKIGQHGAGLGLPGNDN